MSGSVEARHGRGGNTFPGMVPDLAHQGLSVPAVASCRRGGHSYPSLVPQGMLDPGEDDWDNGGYTFSTLAGPGEASCG